MTNNLEAPKAEKLELKQAIAEAPDFKALYEILEKSEGIYSLEKLHPPEELIEWIDGARRGVNPGFITNGSGLRDKVEALLKAEKNPLIQMQFIPTLHKEIYENAAIAHVFDSFTKKLYPNESSYAPYSAESVAILSRMMNKETVSFSDFEDFVTEALQSLENQRKEIEALDTTDLKKHLFKQELDDFVEGAKGVSKLLFKKEIDLGKYEPDSVRESVPEDLLEEKLLEEGTNKKSKKPRNGEVNTERENLKDLGASGKTAKRIARVKEKAGALPLVTEVVAPEVVEEKPVAEAKPEEPKPEEVVAPKPEEPKKAVQVEKSRNLGVSKKDLIVATDYLRSFLGGDKVSKENPFYNPEHHKDLTEALSSFENIRNYMSGASEVPPTNEEVADFKKFYAEGSASGWKVDAEPKVKAEELVKNNLIPPPLREIITLKSDLVDAKLATLGITRDQLAGIAGFEKISDSEGRVLSVLNNIEQIRLRRIDDEARAETEQYIRTSGDILTRVWRGVGFNRRKEIEKRRFEATEKSFNVSEHADEVKGLIDIASFGPDVQVKRDKNNNLQELVREYTSSESFNAIATKYATLPPEYTWKTRSEKEVKEFQDIASDFDKEKNNFLKENGNEGMVIMNKVEFQVRMAQTLNTYPDGAAELTRLAESKGWDKQIDLLKAQIGPGAVGFATGLATRFATKSLVASTIGAVAMPLTALGLAGAFGYVRGKEKAKESLAKQDELMRIGMEEDKSAGKGTKGNFVKVENLNRQLRFLEDKLVMDYGTYLSTYNLKKEPMSLREFNEEKRVAAERLQVRLEYTKQKVEEGKVVFGKDADAVVKQYELIQSMSRASTEIDLVADMVGAYDGKQFANAKGKTRRSRLASLLEYTETKIEKNRNQYVRDRAAISGLVGVATAGLGYEVGGIIHEYFGAHGADKIHEHAQVLRAGGEYQKAAHLEKMTEEGVKVTDQFEKADALLAERMAEKKVSIKGLEPEVITTHPAPETKINIKVTPPPSTIAVPPRPNDIVLDWNTKAVDITRDLPKSPYSEDLKEMAYTTPESAPTPAPASEAIKKPFEYVIEENKSRESAMIQYLREQNPDMSKEEAGRKAHLLMKEMFGPKGEEGLKFVQDGDRISIFEKDGKLQLEVNAEKVQTAKEISTASIETKIEPLSETEKAPQPSLDTQAEAMPKTTPTSEVAPAAPEQFSAITPYEVKAPTNLAQVISDKFRYDGRIENMTDTEKDKVVWEVFVNQFLKGEQTNPGLLKKIGVTSGNIFNIESGTLKIGIEGKDVFGDAIKRVTSGGVSEDVRGFRKYLPELAQALRSVPSADLTDDRILAELKKLRK